MIQCSRQFNTRFRGELVARIAGDLIAINLPAVVFEEHPVEQAVARALGARVLSMFKMTRLAQC